MTNFNSNYLRTIVFVSGLLSGGLHAATNYDLNSPDAISNVLEQHFVGKTVELQMKSGEKLTGIIKQVRPAIIHLRQLQGRESFDAFVVKSEIAAVVYLAK